MSKIVLVSGGFTLLHKGHIRLFHEASFHGGVVVALNSDAWVKRKHPALCFPSWADRAEVLASVRHISQVIAFEDADDTACDAIQRVHPDYFANGGDRNQANPQEHDLCRRLGVIELFDVGGGKVASSRDLMFHVERP